MKEVDTYQPADSQFVSAKELFHRQGYGAFNNTGNNDQNQLALLGKELGEGVEITVKEAAKFYGPVFRGIGKGVLIAGEAVIFLGGSLIVGAFTRNKDGDQPDKQT